MMQLKHRRAPVSAHARFAAKVKVIIIKKGIDWLQAKTWHAHTLCTLDWTMMAEIRGMMENVLLTINWCWTLTQWHTSTESNKHRNIHSCLQQRLQTDVEKGHCVMCTVTVTTVFLPKPASSKQQIVILVYEQQLLSWELRGRIREASGNVR